MPRFSLLIPLAALVFARPAEAQPAHPEGEGLEVDRRRVAGLSLAYSRPPGDGRCGSEPHFREELAHRMGYSPFGSPSPDHPTIVLALRRLDVSITQTKSQMTATMTGLSDDGKPLFSPRSITYPRQQCEQLIGMVAALTADAIRSFIPPLPQSDPPPAPTISPAAAPRREAIEPPAHDSWPMLGLVSELDIATAPVPMLGWAALGARRWPDFSLGLDLHFVWGFASVSPERDIRPRVFAGAITPCIHRGVMLACGLAELGVRHFVSVYGGSDAPMPEVRNPLFAAIGLRLGVAWPVPLKFPLPAGECTLDPRRPCPIAHVRLTVDLLHTPLTTKVFLDNKEVWSSFPLSANLALGLEQHF